MSPQKRLNGIVRNTNLKKGKKKRTGGQKEDKQQDGEFKANRNYNLKEETKLKGRECCTEF